MPIDRRTVLLCVMIGALLIGVVLVTGDTLASPGPSGERDGTPSATPNVATNYSAKADRTGQAAMVERRRYRLNASTAVRFEGTEASAVRVAGTLDLFDLDRREEGQLVAFRIDCSTVDQAFARDLAQPVIARIAADGRLVGIKWGQISSSSRQWIAAMLAVLVCPSRAEQSWQADEADTSGVARVRYERRAHGTIVRQRQEYLPREGQPTPLVKQSIGHARVGADGGLEAVDYIENLELAIPETERRLRHDLQLRCDLVEAAQIERVSAPTADWNGPWWFFGTETSTAAGNDLLAAWRRDSVRGVSVHEVLATLADLARRGEQSVPALREQIDRLARLVESEPGVMAAIERAIATELDAQASAYACSALGIAGTPPARTLLRAIASNARTDSGLRYAAAQSMFQLADLDADTETCLLSLAGDPQGEPSVRGIATLLLGDFVGRGIPEPQRAGLVARLLAVEPQSGDGPELIDWFEALGNSGAVEAMPAVERFFTAEAVEIRVLAITAVRRMPASTAVPFLTRKAGVDADAGVRMAVIDLLAASFGSDPNAVTWLDQIANTDPDPNVRERARRARR